jgi:hypothetical protein
MKKKLFYISITLLFLVGGCKNGADSIPELSTMIFNALKAQKQSMLSNCEPTSKEMEKAIELYFTDTSHTKADRQKEAYDRTASIKITINQRFSNLEQGAKERNIDWSKTKILDFKYSLTDHREDYKDASVRIIIATNGVKNVIVYKAYLFGNRWYLMNDLAWEE